MPEDIQHILGRLEAKVDMHLILLRDLEDRMRVVEAQNQRTATVAAVIAACIGFVVAVVGNAADWFSNLWTPR